MGSVMAILLQAVASGGVKAHHDEEQDPDAEVNDVSHGAAPPI